LLSLRRVYSELRDDNSLQTLSFGCRGSFLSVCLSVCLSVTFIICVKTAKYIIKLFTAQYCSDSKHFGEIQTGSALVRNRPTVIKCRRDMNNFYRATLCVSAVFAVARYLSVCLSVRPSDRTMSRWWIVSTWLKISSNFLFGPVSPSLAF